VSRPDVAEPSRYPIPARPHRVEDVVKRSRFITTAARAPDADAARAFVSRICEEFPDATHNCWAFVVGPPGSTTHVGMSDDGEPHGTAGRPMLTALLHGGVGQIAVVCTRYFGGVKLGTGGLSRAYADGVKHVLESLPTVEKVDRVRLLVAVGYADVDALKRLAAEHGALIEEEAYGADVRYTLLVPAPEAAAVEAMLAEATQGRARIECG
jgi:uncharacterized YigZ family protein